MKVHGWGWYYTQPICLWLLVSVLVLSGLAVAWWVVESISEEDELIQDMIGRKLMAMKLREYRRMATTMSRRLTTILSSHGTVIAICLVIGLVCTGIGFASGAVSGWLWRDHQLAKNQVTYTAVYVQEKIDDKHFFMQPARMKALDSQLCPDAVVDWKKGETLEDWTFEQKHGCKRVIMYHRYPEGELHAGR